MFSILIKQCISGNASKICLCNLIYERCMRFNSFQIFFLKWFWQSAREQHWEKSFDYCEKSVMVCGRRIPSIIWSTREGCYNLIYKHGLWKVNYLSQNRGMLEERFRLGNLTTVVELSMSWIGHNILDTIWSIQDRIKKTLYFWRSTLDSICFFLKLHWTVCPCSAYFISY